MQINVANAKEYLAALPANRRKVVEAVRKVIRKHLPKGYEESVRYGMLTYEVPLSRYPVTYNKQPLQYVGLAAQKNFYGLYLMCLYGNAKLKKDFAAGFKRAGKKLDMGKCCVRFKALEDLPLDVVAKAVASTPVEAYLKIYEASRK